MTHRDWPTILRFALMCGIASPALVLVQGLIVAQVASLILGGGVVGDVAIPNPIYGFAVGAGLGGLGTWLLLRKREQGIETRGIRIAGARYGVMLGSVVFPLYFSVLPFLLAGYVYLEWSAWLAGILMGSTTGALLGFLTASLLTRRRR